MSKIELPEEIREKYTRNGNAWDNYKINIPAGKYFNCVVAIMRANPPHVNHTLLLKELCKASVELKINLGSSNKFNKKNPFKIEEREEMMRLALRDFGNFSIYRLPDFDSDVEWFEALKKLNLPFSEVVSNNQYDLNIYRQNQYDSGFEGDRKHKHYDIIQPSHIIDNDMMTYVKGGVIQNGVKFLAVRKPMYVSGTFVRAAMINNWNWEDFVDEPVANYIKEKGLIKRLAKLCPELKGIPLTKLEENR